MPPKIVNLSKKYMTDSHRITIKDTVQKTDNIKQHSVLSLSRMLELN